MSSIPGETVSWFMMDDLVIEMISAKMNIEISPVDLD